MIPDSKPTWIYVLRHPETREIRYVGQTIHVLKYRCDRHVLDAHKGRVQRHLANWIKKVGKPLIEPVLKTDYVFSDEMERRSVDFFRTRGYRLLNATGGGKRGPLRLTDEQRASRSRAIMGHPVLPSTREKLRQANLGKKHTDAARAKMSLARKGKPHGPEWAEKVAATNRGRTLSAEHRAAVSRARRLHGPTVLKHSIETKAKMAEARRRYWVRWREARNR